MSKTLAISQIEQQIGELPPVEQIKMLERMVRHLKKVLLSQPIIAPLQLETKDVVEKLDAVYKVETSRLDSLLFNAQISSIGRDEWL
jgi:hypothetical protein